MTIRDWTVGFEDIGPDDLPRVGGKGANLGGMTRAGAPVPPGFCVSTSAYDEFLGSVDGVDALLDDADALDPEDVAGVRVVGERLRTMLTSAPFPDVLASEVVGAWETLDEGYAWAVRSSATLEDLPEASFAGQQDTYLNVRGREQVLDAVKRCWASLFTDRAILYRRKHGFGSRSAKLSVVVQRMIRSELSGILFTADPITGHRRVASIDASYGLGEALVSGLVDADNFRFHRDQRTVIDTRIGAKKIEILPVEAGGTETVEVDEDRRKRPSLDAETIGKLVAIAEQIEAERGSPQDIEWCIEGDEIFVVQTRPITTLFPIVDPCPEDLRAYFSFNHVQVMTEPMTPFGMDVFRWVLPIGRPSPSEPSPLIASAAYRLYIDITPALLHPIMARLAPKMIMMVDTQIGDRVLALQRRAEFRPGSRRGRARMRSILGLAHQVVPNLVANLFVRNPLKLRETGARNVELQRARYLGERDSLAGMSAAERLAYSRRTLLSIFEWLLPKFFAYAGAGVLSYKLLLASVGEPRTVEKIARGLEGNVAMQMDLELGDLADTLREQAGLAEAFRSAEDPRVALERGRELAGTERFYAEWDAYIEQWGMRGPGEIEISKPRWRDDPSSLLRSLVGMLSGAPGGHREHHARLAREAEQAGVELIAATPIYKRWWIRRLVRLCRAGLALREHGKYTAVTAIDNVRRAILDVGEELVERGTLNRRDDVWMLRDEELRAAVDGKFDGARELVEVRRTERERLRDVRLPRVVTSEGESIMLPKPEAAEGTLVGVSASTGIVEGRAKVVMDPAVEVLEHGDILVAPFTDPGWTPLFIHAAALVMEVGGLMTHGSVVAREYGIPAVVGVDDATREIKTGDRIRVDGDAGVIVLLDHEPMDEERPA